jgi:hypothetical protein
MKVNQKAVVRWISKFAVKGANRSSGRPVRTALQELDSEQLHRVSGGGGANQLPKVGGW